jgi:hypothetical protein
MIGQLDRLLPRLERDAACSAPPVPSKNDARTGTPRAPVIPEEALIADVRAGLTPSQQVERKLISLLKSNPLPISRVPMGFKGLPRRG